MSQGRLLCVRPSDLLRSGKRASTLGHLPTASSLYRSPQSAILPSWSTASGAAATCRTVWVRYRADGTLLGTMDVPEPQIPTPDVEHPSPSDQAQVSANCRLRPLRGP